MGLAYYLYAAHGILPGDYYRRSQGEKDLIWAFASYEAEQKTEDAVCGSRPRPGRSQAFHRKSRDKKQPFPHGRERLQSLIYDPRLFD